MNRKYCHLNGYLFRFSARNLRLAIIIAGAVAVIMFSACATAQQNLQPALSPSDLQKVMKWIAQEVSSSRQPYCYRQSYGRGVGSPMKCAEGLEEDAALCYKPCKSGYKGVGPVCWQHCTEGFRDDGMFCYKPKAYGRGTGYPWKVGDKAFSLKDARRRCEKKHPQGCEKNGAIIYPKCKPGFHNVGCCVCSPNCPPGQKDIGISCAKESYGRGVGKPLSRCLEGQEKDGLLCYPNCKQGYNGVGPVCWQKCPSGRINCGVGCTTEKKSCVEDTAGMVLAPIMLAVNIATAGSTKSMTTNYPKLAKAMKSLEKAKELMDTIDKIKTVTEAVADTTYMWINDYIANFKEMTNEKVVNELNKRFSGNALLWIQQQYAMNHLVLMLKSDGIETAQNALSIVAAFDPTGAVGVVDAFAKPICKTEQDFPTVSLLSQTPHVPSTSSLTWVRSTGTVPANAFIGGHEIGRTLHICRANYQNGVHPGKIIDGNCNIGWGGKEVTLSSFEILISSEDNLTWVPGPSATGAVIGGYEPGRTLHICRANYQNGVHPGKIIDGNCYIGWGGKEIVLETFEVLIQK